MHFPEGVAAYYRPFSPTDPSDHLQDWYNHFNTYRLFRTLPPTGGNQIDLDPEWTQFWDPDNPRYEPLHQRLMLEFYRLQQLAHQRGLLRDKYLYRVLPEPPTHRVEGSRDLELPGPRPKHVSRHAFQQRRPVAKYGPFQEMHWDNDLTGRPDDTVATEPPKEEPPAESEAPISHPHPVTKDAAYPAESPALHEERTYVDADAEITEPEEHSQDPYDIIRDDPFALIPPELVDQWDAKQNQLQPPQPQLQPPEPPDPPEAIRLSPPSHGPRNPNPLPHLTFTCPTPEI